MLVTLVLRLDGDIMFCAEEMMRQWPPILTPIGGFAVVFVVASILLIAPCGPGCEWPVFAATLLYSLFVIAFRFKVPPSRYTALVLAVISIIFLCERRYTQHQFRSKLEARVKALRAHLVEMGKKMDATTEQQGGGYSPPAARPAQPTP